LVLSQEEQVEEDIFVNAFIPRTLEEVIDAEKDIEKLSKGNTEGVTKNFLKKKVDRQFSNPKLFRSITKP
jgi:hypothetical protein